MSNKLKITPKILKDALTNSSILKDDLTKYVVAKCFKDNTQDQLQINKTIKRLTRTPSYKHFFYKFEKLKTQILKEENQDYVRFLVKTKDMGYQFMRQIDGFNIKSPSKAHIHDEEPPYIYREENHTLQKLLEGNQDVLIIGPPQIGKTRLVFEELRKLKDCFVISFYVEAFYNISELTFSDLFNENNRKLIWFIDDIHYLRQVEKNYGAVWRLYDKLRSRFDDILILATLRSDKENEFDSFILKNMSCLRMSTWTEKEGRLLAKRLKKEFSGFAGTPFSLIGSIGASKQIYRKLPSATKGILRYIKTLKSFLPLIDYSFLREVHSYLTNFHQNHQIFEDNLDLLERSGLITRDKQIVDTWEIFLQDLTSEQDYPYMDSNLNALVKYCMKTRKLFELEALGCYFSEKTNNKTSLDIYLYITRILSKGFQSPNKYIILFRASLIILTYAEKERNIGLYSKAWEILDEITNYQKEFADAYFVWGYSLCQVGLDSKNMQLIEKAIDKLSYCIKNINRLSRQNCADAYFRQGMCFVLKAEMESKQSFLESAISNFKLCRTYLSQEKIPLNFELNYSWGHALFELSRLSNKPKLLREASKKLRTAIDINPRDPYANYLLGVSLLQLAKRAKIKSEEVIHAFFNAFLLAIIEEQSTILFQSFRYLKATFKAFNIEKGGLLADALMNIYEIVDEHKELSDSDIQHLNNLSGISKESDALIEALIHKRHTSPFSKSHESCLLEEAVAFLAAKAMK